MNIDLEDTHGLMCWVPQDQEKLMVMVVVEMVVVDEVWVKGGDCSGLYIL